MLKPSCFPNVEQTSLLKACLLSGEPARQAWKHWTQIALEKKELVSFKLLPLASRNPDLDFPADPLLEKSKLLYRQTSMANQLHWKKIVPILHQLLQAGVSQIVLLKGMAMILHYYRDFGVRTIGDIDLLIPRAELSIAGPLLRASGWKQTVSRFDLSKEEHLQQCHAMNFTHPAGMNLDLHWSLIQENSPIIDQAVWGGIQQLPIKDIPLYIPNPTDLLLQACVHGAKYSPIPLIRWVADAMTLLKHAEIDWDRLIHLGRRARICLPLSTILHYLAEEFAAPIPPNVLQVLQAIPSLPLEHLEYRSNVRGSLDVAVWCRYCLNRGYLTLGQQILHTHKYLQTAARLKSLWQLPFFAIYWICKRLYRRLFHRPPHKLYRT
jgi:hypothetical protein